MVQGTLNRRAHGDPSGEYFEIFVRTELLEELVFIQVKKISIVANKAFESEAGCCAVETDVTVDVLSRSFLFSGLICGKFWTLRGVRHGGRSSHVEDSKQHARWSTVTSFNIAPPDIVFQVRSSREVGACPAETADPMDRSRGPVSKNTAIDVTSTLVVEKIEFRT